MYKKRRLIRSIYIVFAMIFILVLGQDVYTYVQSSEDKKTQEKADTKNNATIKEGQDKALATISSDNHKETQKNADVYKECCV